MLIDMLQLTPATATTETAATSATPPTATATTSGDSGGCTPTLPPVEFLDAESLEALYDQLSQLLLLLFVYLSQSLFSSVVLVARFCCFRPFRVVFIADDLFADVFSFFFYTFLRVLSILLNFG